VKRKSGLREGVFEIDFLMDFFYKGQLIQNIMQ